MAIVWFTGGVILIVIGAVLAIGAVLPRDHIATGSIVLHREPPELFEAIRNVSNHPAWRTGVSRIDVHEGASNSPQSWTEHSKFGPLKMRLGEELPGQRLVTVIDDASLPFGGNWVFELKPENGGTRVRITENGFVKSPPFRFMSKFVMGHDSNLKQFLNDLRSKFGENTKLES